MQISRKFCGNMWTLDLLLQHFHDELKASESCLPVLKRVNENEKRSHTDFTASSLLGQADKDSFSKGNKRCVFCDKEHPSSRCRTVTNIQSRKDILRRDRRCFVCLSLGHLARACRANYLCLKCKKGKHHVTICPNTDNHANNMYGDEKTSTHHCQCSHEKCPKPDDSTTTAFAGNSNSVLLQTARAEVFDTKGSVNVNTRILFDSGSQRSYIFEKVRRALGLKVVRKEKITIKTFGDVGNPVPKVLDVVEFKVKHRNRNAFVVVEALCTENICSPIVNQNVSDAKKFKHLVDLDFADFEGNASSLGIDILVGVDYYHSFINGKVLRGSNGPVASESVLGWVLSGAMCNNRSSSIHCFETHVMRCEVDGCQDEIDLRKELNKFWEVENIEGEKCVVSGFENHIYHNGSRYVSALPFKPDHDSIPENFETAKTRLKVLRKCLVNKDLEKQYDDIFSDYEHQNIIEKVPDCEISKDTGEVHYLPHRPVVRMDKDTTKIRAVFDASCSHNGPSLNNCLYPGPNLLSKIFDVLLRFRLNAVGVIADIKQAFLNIEVDKKHTDFLRFLWYDTNDQDDLNIVIYRFLRVVFGVNCSPYILNATIRQHLEKYLLRETSLIERLIKDFYVDDLVSGCEDSESGKRFYDKVKTIMSEAGLTLRKWVTNDSELRAYFQTKERDFSSDYENVDSVTYFEEMSSTMDSVKRVLGLEWDVRKDEFVMRLDDFLQKSESVVWTKRNILSVSSSVFDPLGFISPIAAKLKTIFQLLCKDKLDWDDRIPAEVESVWVKLLNSIRLKSVFRVSRFCFTKLTDVSSVQLQGFSDSSTESYCAVVYLRFITSSGIGVRFLASKTKVAPIKTLTVPRLELLGCLLLSKLVGEIQVCLTDRLVVDEVFCWSDSQVSLCWIRGKEKSWKPWVENRVVRIRKIVSAEKWHFVKGEDNPADIPTRLTVDFDDSFWDHWINGPQFLLSSTDLTFSDNDSNLTSNEAMIESKTKLICSTATDEPKYETLGCNNITNVNLNDLGNSVSLAKVIDINRFSSLTTLIRVTGFVNRFVNNLCNRTKKNIDAVISDPVLTIEENERSLKMWILSEQATLKLQSNFLKIKNSLNLFEDDGILRLKGRFQNSSLEFSAKFPVLIRGKESYFTRLVVWDAHQNVLHHGVESTLGNVRSKFWIVRGRRTVKDVIRKCVICRRHQGKTMVPPPSPDLPSFRVNVNFSFYSIGIDYAGPLYVKDRDCTSKVYVLLFSCATSRALHLEITPDLGKFAFMRAFERFMARKGRPKIVISDNAKTFKANEVKRFFTELQIQHQFILPASPWWGGFYERMVRTIKTSLRKSLGRSLVSSEQLETLLCKVESIINSRPLAYVSGRSIDTIPSAFW